MRAASREGALRRWASVFSGACFGAWTRSFSASGLPWLPVGAPEALAFASIAGAFLHDAFCAVWLCAYMGARGRLRDTLRALRTRSGKAVMLGALLGGPVGMTGYVVAIGNIGPAYTAVISAFYPAFGALVAVLVLKERMRVGQVAALAVALAGVIGMGYASSVGQAAAGDTLVGLLGAAACVVGWGSEAVLCAWGMRDDAVDNETALQIRETTSALVYGIVVLPLFGAWGFVSSAFPSAGTAIVAASALAGAASYLFYYKGSPSSGRRAAWRSTSPIRRGRWSSACFLLGAVPTAFDVVCCIAIMCGTVLAAADWRELFGRGGAIVGRK